jgi:transcriptional regulator with XRE-family HTH domain
VAPLQGRLVAAAGRPSKPIAPGAPPAAAALGAELRHRRLRCGLTLQALGARTGYSVQHLSTLELASAGATPPCVAALAAEGALLDLLPAVISERLVAADLRAVARRYDDEDVEPTNRRGLLGGAAGAVLGAAALGASPVAAREVDPALPEHWTNLLRLLGRLDMLCGPQDVLAAVGRELRLIAEHRVVARGELRVALMRVEARWSDLADWLSEDTGRTHDRDAWTERVGRLAQEADDLELVAFWRARQGEWAAMARDPRAAELAEAALRVPGVSAQTRAWSARQAALGHALGGDVPACERRLHDAYGFLEHAESPVPPWAHEFRVTRSGTRATEACCWLAMAPAKAIGVYEDALRDWPRDEVRDRGLHRARLALACAPAEGANAFAIAKQTRSASAARELRQLGAVMRAA